MPELPDIVVYVEAIGVRTVGGVLERIRLASPFLLRTVEPPPQAFEGKRVIDVRRLGKRVVIALEADLFMAFHLMIAGRLHWKPAGAATPPKIGQAAFDFTTGTLLLTEAGSKRRAALHLLHGESALAALGRGGFEVLQGDVSSFRTAMLRENRTLKRALTDPSILSGIGNAYSDEILHRARLSPVALTRRLAETDLDRLFTATRQVLSEWTARLRAQAGSAFPGKVTAFREGMAVHGRYRQPCPACGAAIQRIVHADNEINYCPSCQTGGRILADRALSRLLKRDWPRTLEELEELRPSGLEPHNG